MGTRTHKAQIEARRAAGKVSPEQIRANKCEQSRQRNATRKAKRRAKAEQLIAQWQQLSPREQLKQLDQRLGRGVGAKRQSDRIQEAIDSE